MNTKPKSRDYRLIKRKIKKVSETTHFVTAAFYGKAGSGKTTLACTFPKPVLVIDIKEKGTDSVSDVDGVEVIQLAEWEEIEDLYWYLKKEKHHFKTVIWDTVSQLQDLAIRFTMEENSKDLEEAGNWGSMTKKMWGSISSMLKHQISIWRDLEMNVVFIAHDRVFNFDSEEEGDMIEPSVGPRVIPSVASVLNASVNVLGNTFIKETLKKERKLKSGKVIPERRVIDYCLGIGPHYYYTRKIRKPKSRILPDIITDPSYDKIVAIISGEEG